MKLGLAVLGNIAVENVNQIGTMINEGVIDTVYKSVLAYELNTDLLIAAIDTLSNLIKHKDHAAIIGEKGGMEITLRILKTQDFSKVQHYKFLEYN